VSCFYPAVIAEAERDTRTFRRPGAAATWIGSSDLLRTEGPLTAARWRTVRRTRRRALLARGTVFGAPIIASDRGPADQPSIEDAVGCATPRYAAGRLCPRRSPKPVRTLSVD